MNGRLRILGSGTSFGVPVIGCDCAVCTSPDPRDRRTRAAAVIELPGRGGLLIDTPPELRLQLVAAGIRTLDAVLYTHDHADHVAGIDDLRALSVRQGRLPVYGPPEVLRRLGVAYPYIFDASAVAREGTSIPELDPEPLEPHEPVEIAGTTVIPLEVDHGGSRVFAYRVGPVGYVTDAKRIPDRAMADLVGVEVLVVNALFERPHPTHLSIPEAIAVARSVGARETYVTHLTHRYAHEELVARFPDGVAPAYDGLVVPF